MFNKLLILLLSFNFSLIGWSQECNHLISGIIKDAQTNEAIPYASIYIESAGKGTVSNADGTFVINHLCVSEIEVTVSYLGYLPYKQIVNVNTTKEFTIYLRPQSEQLNDVTVVAEQLSSAQRETQRLNEAMIQEEGNKNLGYMLESLSGVSALKSGSVAKPVVQGQYGNRLPVLNNGIAQSGQQWGNDHSPEIDPLSANKISIISGADALQYQGRSLGNMVLVEAESIKRQNKLSGQAGYFFESNGLGNGLNFRLQNYPSTIAWKVNATLKKRGDQQAADYYLTNTGVEEANVAVQLEKIINERWTIDAYLSSFNTQIGVLRGSHIGNLTDLKEALNRDEPFYTNDYFSYEMNEPRQTVNHHMLKLRAKYFQSDDKWLSFVYAAQFNNRKEYDVKRGGRSDIPTLSLQQSSHFIEGKYSTNAWKNWRLKSGMQFTFIDNTNNPETGIRPLIPDYYSYETGIFSSLSKRVKRWNWKFGGRYDYQIQNVVAITSTAPFEIIRYNNNFHSYKLAADLKYHLTSTTQLDAEIGFASRNPEVNELYSNGLHQGVGGIEEGDPNLKAESALKSTLTLNTSFTHKLQFEASAYYQYIDDYIYLNPTGELRLTIRGPFPVFKYEQADAHIYGTDLTAHYHINRNIKFSGQYSYLKGHNLAEDIPLINMPSNNLRASLRYTKEQLGVFKNLTFEIHQQYVFKQDHLLPDQDYAPPPDAYNLIGLKLAADNNFKSCRLSSYIKVDNLFNVSYRDYMNRMRYFADDLGRNIVIGTLISF